MQVRNLIIVAHSMGNEVLVRSLSNLEPSLSAQLIFAAPDVSATEFRDVLDSLSPLMTGALYCDRQDMALKASRLANPHTTRAGDCKPHPAIPLGYTFEAMDHTGRADLEDKHMQHSSVMLSLLVGRDMYHFIKGQHPCSEMRNLLCVLCEKQQALYYTWRSLEQHSACNMEEPPCSSCRRPVDFSGRQTGVAQVQGAPVAGTTMATIAAPGQNEERDCSSHAQSAAKVQEEL